MYCILSFKEHSKKFVNMFSPNRSSQQFYNFLLVENKCSQTRRKNWRKITDKHLLAIRKKYIQNICYKITQFDFKFLNKTFLHKKNK